MKRGCLILSITLLVVLCIAVVVAGAFALSAPATRPSVQINSPRNGEQIAVGQETFVQAIARDDQKIRRVELWVDGALRDAQTTTVSGGISPFPLMANWQPTTPGAHTLIVRAFNLRGGHGQATINIDATQAADRDSDGVPDATDACPDQPGPVPAQGCPDRDADGIRDSEDACPDQPGLPAARGCPAPSANDRDGDGVVDSMDACPDQPGSPFAQGCPDADNDGIRDSEDACPREAGPRSNNGCPIPGDADADGVLDASDACPRDPGPAGTRGCPDSDGDGIADRDDACPSAPGVPGLGGCPDRDGDGVRDLNDLCPATPGPASNAGCPPTTGSGDRDGDGVDDGTDLAPSEPGPAESGGAPVPGGGADDDHDGIADDEEPPGSADESFPDMGGDEAINLVRVDALKFTVNHDYDRVYCYVTSQEFAEHYGPFDLIGAREWDIAEYLGGANSRTLAVPVGQALSLHVECTGYYPSEGLFSIAPANLGFITRSYPQNQWDGHVIAEDSGMRPEERGTPGHPFHVEFRLCLRSCESTAFPPPVLHKREIRVGPLFPRPYFVWTWSGNENNITGYRLYVNGNRLASIPASQANRVSQSLYAPPCGETYEYYVTAYRQDGFNIRESPPSNTVTVAGEACPRRVRVTFGATDIDTLGADDYVGIGPYDFSSGGPYYGSFWATGSRTEKLEFRMGRCKSYWLFVYECRAADEWVEGRTVNRLFSVIRAAASNPDNDGWHMYAPERDYVIVELGEDDDLVIGAIVKDEDVYTRDDVYFNGWATFRAGSRLPTNTTLEYRRAGNRTSTVAVQIEEITGH